MDVNGESMTIESDQLKEAAQQAILDSEAENDRKQEQENSNKMEDTINQVEKLANDATKTEFFKEQLLQKEQALKQQQDLKRLDTSIQKQQEKLKCIEMMYQKEKKKQDMRLKQTQHREEIQTIRNEVENQVNNIKNVFNSKLNGMMAETQRLRQQKMKNLMELKLKITKLLVDKDTKGDISNCEADKEAKRISYCNVKFNNDWFENK